MAIATFLAEAQPLLRSAWLTYLQVNPLSANLLTALPPPIPPGGTLPQALRSQIIGLVSSYPNIPLPNPQDGFTWSNPGNYFGLLIFQAQTLIWVATLDEPVTLLAGDARFIDTGFLET
jgi:hypothetical protein